MNSGSEKRLPDSAVQDYQAVRVNGRAVVEALPIMSDGELAERPIRATQPASILLADECAVTRRGVRSLIETQPQWKVIAEANSGRELVSKASRLRPDVIIVNVNMRELNGLDATRLVLKTAPNTRVLVLTSSHNEEMIERALQAGVRGYVLKSDAELQVVAAVKALLDGRTFFSSAASQVLVDCLRREKQKSVRPGLTIREAEIVQLLAEGNSNKQVAGILGISSRTVENHRAQIMHRLAMRSFSELIRYAIRNGIVDP